MQTVFTNDMVAHVWANQSQSFGRSGNGNFYFDGKTLFSYGSHYPVGVIAGDIVFLNSDKSSPTTEGKHKNAARHATSHKTVLYVPSLDRVWRAIVWLSNNPGNKAGRDKEISSHVQNHIADISQESALALLSLAGFTEKKAKERLAIFMRAHEKSESKRKKEEHKRQIDSGIRMARVYLMREDRLESDIRSILGNIQEIEKERKDVFECVWAIRQRPNALGKNQVKTIKTYYQNLLKAKRDSIARESMYRAHKEYRHTIRHIREYVENLDKSETIPLYRLESFSRDVTSLSASKYVGNNLRVKLSGIAEHSRAIALDIRKKEREEAFRRDKEKRESWLKGESVPYWRGSCEHGGALLRVKGEKLETSHGVSVPLDHAIKVFKAVKACRDNGRAWKRNGETIRVGHFQVDEIHPNGDFKAGCHSIYWQETARIAESLGLI